MRKTLLHLVIILAFAACSESKDPKTITSVSELAEIKVLFGTPFSAITFPTQVTVTFSDKSTENLAVVFNESSYNANSAGSYELEGTFTPTGGAANNQNLKASVTVTVATLKLKTVTEDGDLLYEYFYDDQDHLDHYTVHSNDTEFTYTYGIGNKVTERARHYGGNLYPEKYFYHADGKLDRIEFYYGDNILGQTHTYTYSGSKISRYDNSDQSIGGLKFRTFEYTGDDINKVSFDVGNSWNFTYFTDKKIFTPLVLDPANPQNQITHPVATFTYVELSTYTAAYEFNAQGYPTKETRTYTGDGNKQIIITYTYQ